MSIIKDIQAPIRPYVDQFELHFKVAMQSRVPLLSKITSYIVKSKGKQMRPLFVLLSADVCGKITESTYTAATMIELLHTATLLHDDVVDDAHMRRGFFSINALWKNKYAVLVGDFLLSKGMLIALENEEFGILKIVSRAVKDMSEGELLQVEKARRFDIEEELYFEVIRKKTASLFAACLACGAFSVGSNEETVTKMHTIGEYLGIAFQIKDDLFDYDLANQSGKPAALDIKEQKMTLPLIYLLNKCSFIEKRKYIFTIKTQSNNPEKIAAIIKDVNDAGGIDYAATKMQEYVNKAIELLNTCPSTESLDALKKLIYYTIERKK